MTCTWVGARVAEAVKAVALAQVTMVAAEVRAATARVGEVQAKGMDTGGAATVKEVPLAMVMVTTVKVDMVQAKVETKARGATGTVTEEVAPAVKVTVVLVVAVPKAWAMATVVAALVVVQLAREMVLVEVASMVRAVRGARDSTHHSRSSLPWYCKLPPKTLFLPVWHRSFACMVAAVTEMAAVAMG
jgi:hypothetical protein